MKAQHHNTVRLAAAGAALALLLAGCGGGDKEAATDSSAASSSASSETSSAAETTTEEAAEPADYSTLLVDAADFDAPVEFIMDEPLLNPSGIEGVAALYHTADNANNIGDTIAVLVDPTEAANALANAVAGLGSSVAATPVPSPIGTGGTLAAGTSPDGDHAVTVLTFTEGNAFVVLQFDSAPGDLSPAPPEFVDSVGQLQLDALKAGLPEFG